MFILSNGQKVVCKVISLEKDQERRKLFFDQEGAEFFDYFKAATPELNQTLKIFNEDAFANLNVDSPKPGGNWVYAQSLSSIKRVFRK